MNILETLVQLRDDIKTWVTNNLQELNVKINENTIPIDSELSTTSTNPVQNQVITNTIADLQTLIGDSSVAEQITNAYPEITDEKVDEICSSTLDEALEDAGIALTPVKGVDYWTEEDKLEITEYVKEQFKDSGEIETASVIDLTKFGIYNDGTHPEETTDGINDALQYCHDNNITNIIFPKGTYLVDASRTAKGFEWYYPVGNTYKSGKGIAYRSNQSVDWSDSIVKGAPVSDFIHNVMCIFSQKNVEVKNCNIIGDLDEHITPLKITDWERGLIDANGANEESETGIRTAGYVTQLADGSALPGTFRLAMYLGLLKTHEYTICWYDDADVFISAETLKFSAWITKPDGAAKFKLSISAETYTDRTIIMSLETTEVYRTREFGHGISIAYAENVLLKNLDISKCVSDAVIIDDNQKAMSKNIVFDHVEMHHCRRQGVSFCGGSNNTIMRNCKIHDIQGTSPEAGIDFEHYVEAHTPGGFGPVQIIGCEFSNCNGGWINNFNGYNIYVDECKFHDDKYNKGVVGSVEGHDIFYSKCKFSGQDISVTGLGVNSTVINCHFDASGCFRFYATELLDGVKVIANDIQIYGSSSTTPVIRNCDIKITGSPDNSESRISAEQLINTKVYASHENGCVCEINTGKLIENCDLMFASFRGFEKIKNCILTKVVDVGNIYGGNFEGCTINLAQSKNFVNAFTVDKCSFKDCIFNIDVANGGFSYYNAENPLELIRCTFNLNDAENNFTMFNISKQGAIIRFTDCVLNNNTEYAWSFNPYFGSDNYLSINKSHKCIQGLEVNGNVNVTYGSKNMHLVTERFFINGKEMGADLKDLNTGMKVCAGDTVLSGGKNYFINKGGIFTFNSFVPGTTYGSRAAFYYGYKVYMVSSETTVNDASIFSTSDTIGQEVATGVFCVGDLAQYTVMDTYSKDEIDAIMGAYINDIASLLGGGI